MRSAIYVGADNVVAFLGFDGFRQLCKVLSAELDSSWWHTSSRLPAGALKQKSWKGEAWIPAPMISFFIRRLYVTKASDS